jgi:hypothetical protein
VNELSALGGWVSFLVVSTDVSEEPAAPLPTLIMQVLTHETTHSHNLDSLSGENILQV